MSNQTQPAPYDPAVVSPFLIQPWSFDHLPICPRATSYFVRALPTSDETLTVVSCKTWTCRLCAQTKIRRLAAKTCLASPNRLLTLTIDPAKYDSPRAAFEATAKQVPELIRMLRTKFGPIEYLRVTEQTKKGWPHYHLLVRSAFIPHTVVKTLWMKLTGASIVDLRQVQKTFSAFQYLVKYLSKMHSLDWTERHCSYSTGFFPPETDEKPQKQQYYSSRREPSHPLIYLAMFYSGATVQRVGWTSWRLPKPTTFIPYRELDLEAWGLPPIPVSHLPNDKFHPTQSSQQPLPISPDNSQRHEF